MRKSLVSNVRRSLVVAVAALAACLTVAPALATTNGGGWLTDWPDIAMVLDSAGNPIVVFYDNATMVAHCNQADCAGEYAFPERLPGGGLHPSLALDASGFPVISGSGYQGLTVTHCNDVNCSPDTGGQEQVAVISPSGTDSSLALDASGSPAVSFYDPTDQNVKLAHCADPDCTGNISISVVDMAGPSPSFQFGRETSLALDGSGNPVIAYYYQPTGDLKLVHCNDPDCAGGDESISTVDSAGDAGYYASLALDAAGNPVISYQERDNFTDTSLRLAHCSDADCVGGDESLVTVDGGAGRSAGWSTSLKLSQQGNPVISYIVGSLAELRVVRCNDSNCTGNDEPSALLDRGVAAADISRTSLALNALGDPIVAFTSFGDEAAEVATTWIQNGSFERPLDPTRDWELSDGEPSKDMRVCNNTAFPPLIGACAFKFDVDGSQDVLQHRMPKGSGSPFTGGDKLELRAHVSGFNLSTTGDYNIRVTVAYTDHTSDRFIASIPSGTYGYTQVVLPFSPVRDYTDITIAIQTQGKGTLLVDNVQFYYVQFTP